MDPWLVPAPGGVVGGPSVNVARIRTKSGHLDVEPVALTQSKGLN